MVKPPKGVDNNKIGLTGIGYIMDNRINNSPSPDQKEIKENQEGKAELLVEQSTAS